MGTTLGQEHGKGKNKPNQANPLNGLAWIGYLLQANTCSKLAQNLPQTAGATYSLGWEDNSVHWHDGAWYCTKRLRQGGTMHMHPVPWANNMREWQFVTGPDRSHEPECSLIAQSYRVCLEILICLQGGLLILSNNPSACPHPCVYCLIYPPVCLCLSYASVHLSTYVPFYHFVHLSTYRSNWPIYLSVYHFVYLPVCPFLSLCSSCLPNLCIYIYEERTKPFTWP